jgi:hypothetical protein
MNGSPLAGTAEDLVPIKWEDFKDDVDNERGLFKILSLYVDDKLKRRDGKSFREHLEAKESRRFEAGSFWQCCCSMRRRCPGGDFAWSPERRSRPGARRYSVWVSKGD